MTSSLSFDVLRFPQLEHCILREEEHKEGGYEVKGVGRCREQDVALPRTGPIRFKLANLSRNLS